MGHEQADAVPGTDFVPASVQLRSKLHRPQPPADVIARPELVAQLDAGCQRPLTLVCAPAGCGKTVVVDQWLSQSEWPDAWVSLDQNDSDPRQFLRGVLAALQQAVPGAYPVTESCLLARNLPTVKQLAMAIAGDLDALTEPLFLVLDDYHRLDAGSLVHELVEHVLEHPPISLHLVITTRWDPPLSLLGLKAKGQVSEVRIRDLAFSLVETRLLAEQVAGRSLDDEQFERMHRTLEGWPAGIRLLSLAVRSAPDPEQILRSVCRSGPAVRDYLTQEMLSRLTLEMQSWLRRTSILDRFCPSLCETLLLDVGRQENAAEGERFVAALLREGLFIIPLDSDGQWFRYHHVLQETLLEQLTQQESAETIEALHLRASAWFEAQGSIRDSIHYALKAGNPELAGQIVNRHQRREFDGEHWQEAADWLDMLPEQVISDDPALSVISGWVAIKRRDAHRTRAVVESLDALLAAGQLDALPRDIHMFRGFLDYADGNIQLAAASVEQAIDQPSELSSRDGVLSILFAVALTMSGRHGEAESTLVKLHQQSAATAGFREQVTVALMITRLLLGKYRGAIDLGERLTTSSIEIRARCSGLAGCARLGVLDLHRAVDDLVLATGQLPRLPADGAVDVLVSLALSLEFLGESAEAELVNQRLHSFGRGWEDDQWSAIAESSQARLALARGEITEARRWAAGADGGVSMRGLFSLVEFPPITLARVLAAIGSKRSLAQAETLLGLIRERTVRYHLCGHDTDCMVLQAVTRAKQGKETEARRTIRQALRKASVDGGLRPFREGGPLVVELLNEVSVDDPGFELASRVIAMHECLDVPGDTEVDAGLLPLIEPLTNRELDTLKLLPLRLTNKEIANRLFVSQETVKSHLKGIYQKLGVCNRHAAADIARRMQRSGQLGLE